MRHEKGIKEEYSRAAWFITLLFILLIPFISPEVFRAGAFFLYIVLTASLIFLSTLTKSYLRNRFILLSLAALLIIIAVTTIYSVNPAVSLNHGLYFIFYALIFVGITGLDSERKRKIAFALIASSFFVSVSGLLQRFYYFDKVIPYLIEHSPTLSEKELFYLLDIVGRRRVIATFASPNLLASYLVMINLVIFGFLFAPSGREDKKGYTAGKVLFFIVLAANTSCLWFSRSFAGLASFIFGIVLFFILMTVKGRAGQLRQARLLFIILAVCIFALFAALFINRYVYGERAYNLSVALQDRIIFWKAAWQAIMDKPFSFVGLGNFGYIYRIYAPSLAIESGMAHNLFLQLWVEAGIYGLLAFIWFLAAVIYNTIKNILNTGMPYNTAIIQIGLLSAVCAFLLHNMAGFSFFLPQVAMIWWILCSLAIGHFTTRP